MEDIVNKHRQALNFNDAGTTINNDVHQKKEWSLEIFDKMIIK